MKKVALITGITGQDGAYLTELLLNKSWHIHGIVRRSSIPNTQRLEKFINNPKSYPGSLHLHDGDLSDAVNLLSLIKSTQPDRVYNLGAQSHVKTSFDLPEYTANVDALGTLRILEAIRLSGLSEHTRFYQASTSELYGLVQADIQSETTPFYPRSPYAVAKLYGYWISRNYREAYGIFASNGILFNHESPLRGELFVTRKISMAVARIALGKNEVIELGNLNAKRDWGHARDYVEGMYKIMEHEKPDDFVLATGEAHSVRDYVDIAFDNIGRSIVWEGTGVDEVGRCTKSGELVVRVNPDYFRPSEVEFLLGDPGKAERELGWAPKVSFSELVCEMVDADIRHLKQKA